MRTLKLPLAMDCHVHLRNATDDSRFGQSIDWINQYADFAVCMPNTDPPITTVHKAMEYRRAISTRAKFVPLVVLYLTEETTPYMVRLANSEGFDMWKLYPRGVTTGSQYGVRLDKLAQLQNTFIEMEKCDHILAIHGQDPDVYLFDQEPAFLDTLEKLATDFPSLRISFEHISTRTAIDKIIQLWLRRRKIIATITPQHLLCTFDDVAKGKLRPHNFCIPPYQRPEDREALVNVATSGLECFVFGTDHAPHNIETKECAEGCAGVCNAPVAIPTVVEIFEKHNALDKLPNFLTHFAARFHNLEFTWKEMTLVNKPWQVPERIGNLVPFRAGQTLSWQIVS